VLIKYSVVPFHKKGIKVVPINSRDIKFFNMAKAASELSTFVRVHIGAVVVLKNEVIAVGQNVKKSHPLQSKWASICNRRESIWLHAEMHCLTKLINTRYDLSNARIYIFRHDKKGQKALSRPCEICMTALRHYGINQILYTIKDGYAEEFLIKESK